MKPLPITSLCLGLAAWLGAGAAQSQAATPLKVGDPAPNFELQGSDGKAHKLSDYKGKKAVVVAWFPKAFTGGCTAECKSLRASGNDIRKFDVAYFAASADDAETNKKFAESLQADYPILSDPTRETAKAYGVVTPERNVPLRWTYYIGKDGKILFIDDKVQTASHGNDVALKLKELGIGEKK
jgi:thioredoxin-dependent peroxiredoxin